jgi:hypothetical protein
MNRAVFANLSPRTYAREGGFAAIFQILWRQPHGTKWVKHGTVANRCVTVDHHMRNQFHIIAQNSFRADMTPRTDRDPVAQFGARINQCPRMDTAQLVRSIIIAE